MKRLGLGASIDVVGGDYTFESGQKAAVAIADRAGLPTAVFAANDLNALGMISEFNRLGIDVQAWGGTAFTWADADGTPTGGTTVWSVAPEESEPFAPSTASFMVNYRVEDLRAVIAALREEGCTVLDTIDESEHGTFGWVMDPEGNKVELWQPPAGQ